MVKSVNILILGLMFSYSSATVSSEINQPIHGVGLDRTRIVMSDGEQLASYGIRNRLPVPLLASSWVSDLKGNPTSAFVVTPSVFQLHAGKTGKAQIRLVEELPLDRESIFWLTVNTISEGTSEKNQMKVALGQKIKVFYRPKGLKGNTKFSADKLKWAYNGGNLIVRNPTALSVTISDICNGNERIGITGMVLPFSDYSWRLPMEPKNFTFKIIDEHGGEVEFPLKVG